MASRKLTRHRLYPVQVHPHMPSQTSYLVQVFTFICPAKERTQLHVSSSYTQPKTIPSPSCFVRAVTLTVHLHFIPDVDIHLHHLHVHSTRPLPRRDVPLVHRHPTVLRVTRLLLPPTRGPLDEGQESEACTSPGQYFASLIIN